jgi:hypothetical protein
VSSALAAPEMASDQIGGDVYWWSAKRVGSSFALIPYLRYGLTGTLFLDVWVPFAANLDGPPDAGGGGPPKGQSRFGLGNPTVGLHWAKTFGPLTFYIGGRGSFPMIHAVKDADQAVATAFAADAMALYDAHFWAPYFPASAFGGLEVHAGPLFIRGQFDPGVWLPLESNQRAELVLQARGEIEGRGRSGWGGGGALQLAHFPGLDGDNAQSSIEGFGGYDNGGLFLRMGLLLALDPPLGFGFDQGKVATLHFRIGGYL